MRYTEAAIREAVSSSISIAGVLRELGIKQAGGSHAHISRKIRDLGIDTSHMLGQYSNKGVIPNNKKHWSEILVLRDGGRRQYAHKLRRAMLENGKEYRCIDCGNTGEWRGKSLTLEVDHANGNWLDDRPENVNFRCPNCHTVKTMLV